MNPFQMRGRKIAKTHARKNVRRVVFVFVVVVVGLCVACWPRQLHLEVTIHLRSGDHRQGYAKHQAQLGNQSFQWCVDGMSPAHTFSAWRYILGKAHNAMQSEVYVDFLAFCLALKFVLDFVEPGKLRSCIPRYSLRWR